MKQTAPPPVLCANCQKPDWLCICSEIRKLSTRHHVLILQHPQEPDKELGTARVANLALTNSTLKIGLSWRSLSHALGREVQNPRWAILYLGSGFKGNGKRGLNFVSKSASLLSEEESDKIREGLEGIVVLDGTWSQAKTLWWRNAWLLKLKRAVLVPTQKSLYGALRKEPRRECLSTIESIAESLADLDEPEEISSGLRTVFQKLLDKYKDRPATLR
jgi:DTW domain-containing protein YfiP